MKKRTTPTNIPIFVRTLQIKQKYQSPEQQNNVVKNFGLTQESQGSLTQGSVNIIYGQYIAAVQS